MKFSLVLLVALGLSGVVNAGPISSSELNDVFAEFLALVPQEDVTNLFVEYLGNDPEVQAAVAYASSAEFGELVKSIESIEEVLNFYEYLAYSGVDIYGTVNKFNDAIGIAPMVPRKPATTMKLTGGVAGLMKDIKALLPLEKIQALYEEKLKTSPAFVHFTERLGSPEFQKIVDTLYANDEYLKIIAYCKAAGIDFHAITNLVASMFGIKFPSSLTLEMTNDEIYQSASARSALDNDLQEFVNLLPQKAIRKIATKHYIFDREFRRAIKYIRSEQFYVLVRKLHQIPEYNEILAILESLGLDVQSAIRKIHEAIKFPSSLSIESVVAPRTIAKFIKEVKAALPINQITALYKHKMETSADFRNLVEVVKSEKFQAVTNALFADVNFQDFLHKAQSHGVDLQAVSDFFLTVFGIKTPPGIIN